MNGYFQILLAVVIAGAGFGGGWEVKAWKDSGTLQAEKTTNAKQLADMSKRDNDALHKYIADGQAMQAQRDALQAKLTAQDAAHTKELSDAKQSEANFRACVASGKCGLRVNATCARPATVAGVSEALPGSGVDTGTGIRLTADAESGYYALRDGLARQRIQLAACQGALKTLTGQ